MAQRHWTDRRKAAKRRMWLRPKPTPQSVIDAMKAQQHEVEDIEAESERLVEKLELKITPKVKAKKPVVKKQKAVKSKKTREKVVKPEDKKEAKIGKGINGFIESPGKNAE